MPAEEWQQPGEGGLSGVVCWLKMTNRECFVLAGVTPWDEAGVVSSCLRQVTAWEVPVESQGVLAQDFLG